MARSALLLLSIIPLAGCHMSGSRAGGDENVNISAGDNGQVSFTLPFGHGEVKLPEGMFANGHFDIDGVKMIPGGTVRGFNVDAGEQGATVRVAFNAPKSPDVVRAYFLDQFRKRGDAAAQSGNAVSGRTRDGESFVITAESAPEGSSGTIAIQSKR